jgi:dTDP-D-glucose 4,6-dehydratase
MNKIFITGGSGFIGTNFIYYCLHRGYTIMNYDNLTYAGNKYNYISKDELKIIIDSDSNNSEYLKKLIENN